MGTLADYYAGNAGAENLDWREREELVMRGEPLRYADPSRLSDRDIADYREMGGTMAVPNTGGGYSMIRPEAGVLPGGARMISQGELLARGRNAAAGGRPLDDPFGLYQSAERGVQSAAMIDATKRLDYLTQFMAPEKAIDEVRRQTGVNLGGRVESTPNLLKRRADELDIAGKVQTNRKTSAEATSSQMKAEGERMAMIDEPAASRDKVDQTIDTLERVREAAAAIRTSGDVEYGTGVTGAMGRKLNDMTGYETAAARLKTNLDTLKGQVALQAMAQLKALSATGATGFGALSAPELALLENSIVNLQNAQGERGLKQALQALEMEMDNARTKAELRYRQRYGDRAISSVAPPRPFPANKAAARPGEVYSTPKGPMKWTGTGFVPTSNWDR